MQGRWGLFREGPGLALTIEGVPSPPHSVSPQGCDKPVWDVTCHGLSPQTAPCSVTTTKHCPQLLPEEQAIRQRLLPHIPDTLCPVNPVSFLPKLSKSYSSSE